MLGVNSNQAEPFKCFECAQSEKQTFEDCLYFDQSISYVKETKIFRNWPVNDAELY
jgi:hypothetical protein